MSWVYVHSDTDQRGFCLYTVGHYSPDGKWHPDSDHNSTEAAAERCHYLNGGMPELIAVLRDLLGNPNVRLALSGVTGADRLARADAAIANAERPA